jgi:hypothetical protein
MCWFNIFDKEISQEQINRILFSKFHGGFMDAYYKILKVMDVNKNSTNPVHEAKTGLWAWRVIDNRKMFVANQFRGKVRQQLLNTMNEYIYLLQDKHQEVRLQICKNIAAKSKEKYFKAIYKVTGEEVLVTRIPPNITYDGWGYNCWTPDGIRYEEEELHFIDE